MRKLNLLALPKDPDFMRCFVAPPGMVLVDGDLRAVEPHALAHFSQDRTLLSVYGKEAWDGHDIYLIAGMRIPGLQDRILPTYTLTEFSHEGVKAAKQAIGKERSTILKPSYLGWIYGLGEYTLSSNLEIPLAQARTILRGMDRQFAGKQALHDRLEREWAQRGGWIINGRGRPICVDRSKKKDLVNRLVQSSAHDALVRILYHVQQYRKQHKIGMRPYIPDYHDEGIFACYEDEVVRCKEAIEYGFDRTNDELNWTVVLKHGGLKHGTDLSIRCDD